MKSIYQLCFIALFMSLVVSCKKENGGSQIDTNTVQHPQILLLEGQESQIEDLIASAPVWEELHSVILKESNKILGKSLLQRKLTGRRLLSVSRECLRRVFFLSYTYRMTQDKRFLQRAEEEMVNVAGFMDWNPSHFLDVAEMTMGLAIGYDWLFDELEESAKLSIRQAIKNKGLEPSFNSDYNWFVRSTNNWNQVCNAGMTFGALAVADAYPELSKKVIDRALETIKLPMSVYQPDGAYPEGYAYWGYGTGMNVMFLDAIEKALGSDYGLPSAPGFLPSAEFQTHMIAPSGVCYNWGDCNAGGSLDPAMFWFASKTQDPSLLYMENRFLQVDKLSQYTWKRLLPAMMIWAKDVPVAAISEPAAKFWVGQGDNPVALMRTSWSDPDAIYLGFKAGSPSVNHGHMDIGSFIMEADGVRWVSDMGKQNYESLESKGMRIFGKTQDAERWTVYRFNNLSHSTLTIDGEHQRVEGAARIDRFSEAEAFPFAISDISTVYDDQLQAAKRGVSIIDEQYVLVQDEVKALDKTSQLRWAMVTEADVNITSDGATLTKDGQTLYFKVKGPDNLEIKTWSTAPTTDYDAPNPGTILLGFDYELPPNTSATFQVYLVPEKALSTFAEREGSLADW